MSAGRNSSRTRMSPPFAVLADHPRQRRRRRRIGARRGWRSTRRRTARSGCCRSSRRRRPRRAGCAPPSSCTGLTVPDLVEREGARTADRPAGLDRQLRHGDAERRALGARRSAAAPRPAPRGSRACRRWCRRCRSRRRGPARRSSIPVCSRELGVQPQRAAGRDLEALGVEDLRADVGVHADQVELGCFVTASRAARAGRPRSRSPNFWSSCAVAMYSWVCASTPVVTRTITRGRTPSSAASARSRAISSNESTTIRPTPTSAPARSSATDSCCCRAGRQARVDARRAARPRAPPGADVDAEAFLDDPAGDGRTQEGLAGVVDVASRRTPRRTPGPASAGRPRPARTPACRTRGQVCGDTHPGHPEQTRGSPC